MMGLRHYFNATAIRISAILLSAMGGLFLFPFILRSLGENDFGIWSIAAAITSYFLLVDFGISLACTRFLSLETNNPAAWKRIISNSLALAAVVMIILALAGFILLICLYLFGLFPEHRMLYTVVALVAIESGISMLLRVYQSVLRANVQYLELGYFEILRVVLRLSGLSLILYYGGGLLQLVIFSGFANVLFFAASFIYVRFRYKQTFFQVNLINTQDIKALFNFGKFAILVQVSELFRYRMDGIFVGLVMGLTAVAHFAILITMIDMAVQILSRFLSYWDTITIRYVGEKAPDEAMACVFKAINIGFVVSGIFILNFLLMGELFLQFWVGEKYQYLIHDLVLMGGIMLVITLQMAMTPFLNANGLQKKDAFYTIVDVGLKLALIFPFIHWFEFRGAILATLIPGLLVALFIRLRLVAVTAEMEYLHLLWKVTKTAIIIALGIATMWLFNEGLSTIITHAYLVILIMMAIEGMLLIAGWFFIRSNKTVSVSKPLHYS